MPKKVKKNINQRKIFRQYEINRVIIKSISNNFIIGAPIRWKIQLYFLKLPAISSVTRIKNICILTGRSRSIYRFFKLSRIQLRKWASYGFLPGVSKYSW